MRRSGKIDALETSHEGRSVKGWIQAADGDPILTVSVGAVRLNRDEWTEPRAHVPESTWSWTSDEWTMIRDLVDELFMEYNRRYG